MSSFFGTDGIRGKTSLDDIDEEEAIRWLEEKRTLTPSFVRVLGEALSHCQPGMAGEGATVVIGWDQRPHNAALVDALTLGLRLTGSRVIHVGECATPSKWAFPAVDVFCVDLYIGASKFGRDCSELVAIKLFVVFTCPTDLADGIDNDCGTFDGAAALFVVVASASPIVRSTCRQRRSSAVVSICWLPASTRSTLAASACSS